MGINPLSPSVKRKPLAAAVARGDERHDEFCQLESIIGLGAAARR
jgi:hypothetical protein